MCVMDLPALLAVQTSHVGTEQTAGQRQQRRFLMLTRYFVRNTVLPTAFKWKKLSADDDTIYV